jgi:hypothetical protein
VSEDFTKIAYVVPPASDNVERAGLWIIETINLPLGFNRDPHRITDGDLTTAKYEFSPDAREILLTTQTGAAYLLDISDFTPQAARANISAQLATTRLEWEQIRSTRAKAKIAPLPDEIENVLASSVRDLIFSPDENRILYTATQSATIPEGVVRQLPGSSTQKQDRQIAPENKYVYDVREDRNFKVAEEKELTYWIPNSLNLVIPEENQITILDYDGTNRKVIFRGNYVYPIAYPSNNVNRLLLLTNFGSTDSLTNLYWLSLN